jgi:hypothetical protein
LPTLRDADRNSLTNGIAQYLPTATLRTKLDDIAELDDAEEEAYAITRLLSLVTGASVGGAIRRIAQGAGIIEESYLEWPTFGTARAYGNSALIRNHPELADALRVFMSTAMAPFRAQDEELALSRVVGYLEQARSNSVADVRIALCVFALETLTHRLCLREGLTAEQLSKMNIQQKLNRARKGMGMDFIDKDLADDTRDTVRNPLLHTGEIPGLSMAERATWYDNLYALAFKMLLILLTYKGRFFDLSNNWSVTTAPVYPPVRLMELTNGAKIDIASYDCDYVQARRFVTSFRAVWDRLPEVAQVILQRHWMAGNRSLSVLLTEKDPPWGGRGRGYASSSPDGTGLFCWSEVLPRIDDDTLATTIAHELGHMAFIAIGEPAHQARKNRDAEWLIAELLRTPRWNFNQKAADEWMFRNLDTDERPAPLRDQPLGGTELARKQQDYDQEMQRDAPAREKYRDEQIRYFQVVVGTCSPEVAEIVRTDPDRLGRILRGEEPEPTPQQQA